MDIAFAPSFFKSLKKLRRHNTWWYKTYEFFRYDLHRGIKNILFFWRVIWRFRSWDANFQLRILARSLEPLAHTLEHYGNEVEIPRMKKVAKIKRAIEILKNQTEDNYIEMAEKQLGYEVDCSYGIFAGEEEPQEVKDANTKIFSLSSDIKEKEWRELWRIFEGQNINEYIMLTDRMSREEKQKKDHWNEWFDGTDMRGWWD